MTRELRSLKSPGIFLQSRFSTSADLNLISQVEYWSISRRVFEHFGADVERTVAGRGSAELGQLNDAYDSWFQDWDDVVPRKDDRSRRIFDLYFHAGKLYLFSHVFRGPSHAQSPATNMASNRFVQYAFQSALSVVRSVTEAEESGLWLETLPSYFGTMIAFACVCLVRSALQETPIQDSRTNETLHHLRKLAEILRMSSIADAAAHPLLSIAKSLEAAMPESGQATQDKSQVPEDAFVDFDFDAFASDTLDLSFPGAEDLWMLCPDEMVH